MGCELNRRRRGALDRRGAHPSLFNPSLLGAGLLFRARLGLSLGLRGLTACGLLLGLSRLHLTRLKRLGLLGLHLTGLALARFGLTLLRPDLLSGMKLDLARLFGRLSLGQMGLNLMDLRLTGLGLDRRLLGLAASLKGAGGFGLACCFRLGLGLMGLGLNLCRPSGSRLLSLLSVHLGLMVGDQGRSAQSRRPCYAGGDRRCAGLRCAAKCLMFSIRSRRTLIVWARTMRPLPAQALPLYRRASVCGRLLGASHSLGVVDRLCIARSLRCTGHTLHRPMTLILRIMSVGIIAPGIVLSAISLPAGLVRIDSAPLSLPAGFRHGLVPVMLRREVEARRPSQVLSRLGRLPCSGFVGQGLPIRAVDHRQLAVAIAIAVLRVLHEIGFRCARRVIKIAYALGQLFSHPLVTVIALPDQRPLPLIIICIVRRRVGQGLTEAIGAIQISIAVAGRNPTQTGRARGRQGGPYRRGYAGRRRRHGQGQGGERRGGVGQSVPRPIARRSLPPAGITGGENQAGGGQQKSEAGGKAAGLGHGVKILEQPTLFRPCFKAVMRQT